MKFIGILIQLHPIQTGTSKNGPWSKQGIIETEGRFPKKICITA